MTKQTTYVQRPYRKAWMSAGIFLATVVVGGLAIFAATNLDNLKAGTNGNTLTATSRDSLIEHVKNHDIIIGEGLSKVDADVLRVESKVDALGGFGSLNTLDTKLTALSTQIHQMSLQNSGNFIQVLSGLMNFSLRSSGIKSQLSGIEIKINGVSGLVVNKINGLSGLMVNNFTTLKNDTSTLKSDVLTLTTNITRVEGKIDLLSGDTSELQEIQNAIRSLKQEIRSVKQETSVGSGDSSGIVLVVGNGNVTACQKGSLSPYCTTQTLNGAAPNSNIYGYNGIVLAVGNGKVMACQKGSLSPYCTIETLNGATPNSNIYG